jgi:hypothetical protein
MEQAGRNLHKSATLMKATPRRRMMDTSSIKGHGIETDF